MPLFVIAKVIVYKSFISIPALRSHTPSLISHHAPLFVFEKHGFIETMFFCVYFVFSCYCAWMVCDL